MKYIRTLEETQIGIIHEKKDRDRYNAREKQTETDNNRQIQRLIEK